MDVNHKKAGKIVSKSEDVNDVGLYEESDGDDESQSLLHPPKKTSLLSSSLHKSSVKKPKRKVQWLDKSGTGSQLAEILEFVPSDQSDSDDDESDSCICTIM